MFGKQGGDRLSAYAGEFVPTGERPARQRRGSDPTLSALRTEENDADRSNPRLPYQLQPNARPRVLAHHEPYPGSPAAALRGQVYERLEEMATLVADAGPRQLPPEVLQSNLAGSGVGSLVHMLPVMREEGDKRAHSDIIQAFAKQSIRLECPTEELISVLCAAVFAFEVYRLGEPEFMSSVAILDSQTRAVEMALVQQQDEAASDLRKLIRTADAKMDAVRKRLAIASTPERALDKFHEMVACLANLFPQSKVRPALVDVSNGVLSSKVGTHVAQLHRLADQAGMLYTRQCSRLIVKRQRQVEMLGRRLAHCAEKLQAPATPDDDVAAAGTRKARRMFAESIRQMKKIGEDVGQVITRLCESVRDPSLVDAGALGPGVEEALRSLEDQLTLIQSAIEQELTVAESLPIPERSPTARAAQQTAATRSKPTLSPEAGASQSQNTDALDRGVSTGGGTEAIAVLANGVAAAALREDSADGSENDANDERPQKISGEGGGDKKKVKKKTKKKTAMRQQLAQAGAHQGRTHRRSQSEPVFSGWVPGMQMQHSQPSSIATADATKMPHQTSQFDPQQHGMQLMLDPTDGPPSWEAGLDPYGGLSPIYGYQRATGLGSTPTAAMPHFHQHQPYMHHEGQNQQSGQVTSHQMVEMKPP
jgi:hypothetical protein